MRESFFARANERKRRSVADLQKDYPGLLFDAERDSADRTEAPFIEATLGYFLSAEGDPPAQFQWDDAARERLSSHPVYQREVYRTASFEALPTLNRATLRTYQEPFDYQATEGSTVYADQTSGTSGLPLNVYYSQKYMAQYLHLNMIKVAVTAGIADIGRRPIFSVRVTDNDAYKEGMIVPNPLDVVGLSVIWHLNADDSDALARFTKMLADLDPEVLIAKPNLYRILLAYWKREAGAAPSRPRCCVYGGAMLPSEVRSGVAEFFGCPVVSAYAISEAGYLGSECAAHNIHLDESVHDRFESVQLEGSPTDSSALGELAVTSMSNDCMPLVRYRIGDIVEFSRHEACVCGRPGPLLKELRGRTTLVFDLGEGLLMSPTRYMDLFKQNPELKEYQLTQKKRRSFLLSIELRPGSSATERESACLRIRDAIAAGMPVPVEIRWTESVFEQEGAKYARFRSEVSEAAA